MSGYISELPCSHIVCKDMLCSYEQIYDVEKDHFCIWTDGHTQDIAMSGPYEQISDDEQD